MDLAIIVSTSNAVAETRSRKAKITRIADALGQASVDVLPAVTSYLAGRVPQGRVSVGWRTLARIKVPPAYTSTLSVMDVDSAISMLADLKGQGSQGIREQMLRDLLGRATDEEQQWLRALLMGELRQGALDGIVAQALAVAWSVDEEAVRRALMLAGDLSHVAAAAAAGGNEALRAIRLTLMRPVQPMLAQTAPDITTALDGITRAAVEVKFDGTRVQAHRDGDVVRLYSRSLRDVTAELPGVVHRVRALPVQQVVLDGEALGLDADGRPLAFQDSMAGRGNGGGPALRPFFFDVLHIDGEDLLDAPLEVRRQRLTEVVPSDALAPGEVVADGQAAAAVLRTALAAGHEGVMVKSLDAPYEAGRRGASWRKVKPVHVLDLVVLAVEWGSGRRRGTLSNLHLGARDPDTGGFVTLGKTFKGLTDEMLAWQTERFLDLETRREAHVVHVRPVQVVEVAFDGLQRSTRYPGGLALRFARVRRYRADKSAGEADTIATAREIHEGKRAPQV